MTTLGRVHGIFFAVKQTSPTLYSEFLSTLGLEGDRARLPAAAAAAKDGQDVLLRSALSEVTREAPGGDSDEAKLRRQMASLGSPHSALPFSIINHGNLRYIRPAIGSNVRAQVLVTVPPAFRLDSLVFRQPGDAVSGCSPSSLLLPGLSRAHVGSPLLDILAFLIDERSTASKCDGSDDGEALEVLLRVYHAAFSSTCGCLRASADALSFR